MEKHLVWQEKKINYTIQGNGNAIVLLHGFPESLHIWDQFIESFNPNFKIIAIDLPGFGKSSVYSPVHTMSFMAQAVKAVLVTENVSKAILVGHSMGGYVSLAFLKLFPENLTGIVLLHSQAAGDSPEAKINRARTIEVVKKDHKDFIGKFIPDLFARENVSRLDREIEALKQQAYQTSSEAVVAALAGMSAREDSRDLLKQSTIPVFFVVGKKDTRIPLSVVTEQMSLPKDAEALLLDDVGHMGFMEAPEKIFPAIESFCERTYQAK